MAAWHVRPPRFVTMAAAKLGIRIEFTGSGKEEKGVVAEVLGDQAPAAKVGDVIVAVDPRYYRPAEVPALLGDASKARVALGWQPAITLEELCAEMVAADLAQAKRQALLRAHGYSGGPDQ